MPGGGLAAVCRCWGEETPTCPLRTMSERVLLVGSTGVCGEGAIQGAGGLPGLVGSGGNESASILGVGIYRGSIYTYGGGGEIGYSLSPVSSPL